MKCSEIQSSLALYADDVASESEAASVNNHLVICPLCRQKSDEYREIRSLLTQIRRPAIGDSLRSSIKAEVRSEKRRQENSWLPLSVDIREWLQMRLMPYSVGVFASVLIGVTFLTMMFSGFLRPLPTSVGSGYDGESASLASNSNPYVYGLPFTISPSEFSHSRIEFASESPSINPQGALVAMTKSLVRGGMKDDEVVVVADVFGNGLARISEVVESPRNRRAMDELEKAFRSDSSSSPFVPAVMENRPENMRVVLRFQSVDVSIGFKPEKGGS